MSQVSLVRQGIIDAFPIAASYIPIAASFGVLGVQQDLSVLMCFAMSAFVFAGASQFVVLGLIASGADVVQIVIGTFFLNLRHLIMGISLKNQFGILKNPKQSIFALLITDETYALTANKNGGNINYFFGVGLCSYLAWLAGTLIGAVFSQYIPENVASNFTIVLYALFITLLVPSLKTSKFAVLASGISVIVSVVLYDVVGVGWSILVATLVASIVTGFFVERYKNGQQLDCMGDRRNVFGNGDS